MSFLGSVVGSIFGASAAKKKNSDLAAQYTEQQGYANKTSTESDYLAQLAQALQSQGSGFTDSAGGTVAYDPSTGTWKSTLGAPQQAIQNASYATELAQDQTAKTALLDAERQRQQASSQADTALRDYGNFQAGVGKIDPTTLAGTLRANRTAAVNAGYDDAARAASTIGLRTGTSAGDALTTIARNRSKDIATTLGDPENEALQEANTLNTNTESNLLSKYNMFNKAGTTAYQPAYNTATYGATADANAMKATQLNLDKYNTVGDLAGTAANGYTAASAGLRQAAGIKNAGTEYNINGKATGQIDSSLDALLKKMAMGG